jgi:2-C-methyl-D-erythritol 4-phosphate cytidylyltransferase
MRVVAIIPAAGLGTRMAAHNDPTRVPSKQFLSLAGEPVLMHTVRRFFSVPRIAAAVLVVRPNEIENVQTMLRDAGFGDRTQVVEGGEKRQDSVLNGLRALTTNPKFLHDDDIVLVHDAVRPLTPADAIDHCIDAVEKHGAAIVGLPAVDTVKLVERTADGALVSSTVPRERVVMAQTPQGFRFRILHDAMDQAIHDGFQGTDEASLVERAGYDVAVVMGSASNFKITNPGDLELAAFYLKANRG